MTNAQLYFAIGVPVIIYLFGFTLNVFVIIWQVRSVEGRLDAKIDALKEIMIARFEAQTQALLRVEQVMDARLKHLEER